MMCKEYNANNEASNALCLPDCEEVPSAAKNRETVQVALSLFSNMAAKIRSGRSSKAVTASKASSKML